MKNVPGTLQEGGAAFPVTQWDVVLDAVQSQSPEVAQAALAGFCQDYWPPVYTFLRRRGYPASNAQDLTQAFFVHLLESNTLKRAQGEKGRLRAFLLGSLQNFLSNQRDREQALKRGGGQRIISMDDPMVEAEAATLAANKGDDASGYDRAWAAALLRRTWDQLSRAFVEEGKAEIFEELKGLVLGGDAVQPDQEEIATRLHLAPGTLRMHLHRMRLRYRELLRAEVARTVTTSAEVEAEMHYLYRLLTS